MEEYINPFIVFQNAFAAKSLNDFEFFLCEITHLSLSPSTIEFDYDLMTPYIHLICWMQAILFVKEALKRLKMLNSLEDKISCNGIEYPFTHSQLYQS
ncbi:hypothetical protein [Flavobacterium sp. XS2P39]|uniref:hypothetical protein n=1 Tax=Flavobacterium sp. XS2P39 TaxID=3401725 RepID=UPI003AB08854